MQIFLDTAEVSEIKQAAKTGLIDGITTNPSLIAKSGRRFETVIKEIVKIVDGPISAEVISTKTRPMLKEGRELASIHPNITVKVPMIPEAMPVVTALAKEGIKTNVTLVFSTTQAMLAAKAGATFVSPFVGRLDDIGEDGIQLVSNVVNLFETYRFPTQVLAASMRHPHHVLQAAEVGADVATIPLSVFEKLFNHPLTDNGLETFLADWKKAKK